MGLSCCSCRYRSQNRAFFRPVKRGLFGLRRWLCLGCKPVPRGRLTLELIATSGLMMLTGCGLLTLDGAVDPIAYFLVFWGFLILQSPFVLAVHELGHASVAVLLGRRLYQINIGTGRPFKAFNLGGTRLAFGRDLGFGYVVQLPLKTPSRWGDIAFIAAGAVANLAVAGLLLHVVEGVATGSTLLATLMMSSVVANGLTGLLALIPSTHSIDGRALPSDGRQILQVLGALWTPRQTIDWSPHHDGYKGIGLILHRRWPEAEVHYREAFARHPDQPGFLGGLMFALGKSQGHEAARRCAEDHDAFLRQEREVPAPMAAVWCYAWDMAAWSLVRSPAGDVASADVFARRAVEVAGTTQRTAIQGAILTRSGEPEQGLAQMVESFRTLPSIGDRLEVCDFIVAHRLESEDLKTADFEDYAVHLRAMG